MLVAACVLPHPPLLFPEVSVSTSHWLAELRGAVADSVKAVIETAPDVVIAVGRGPTAGEWDGRVGGTMRAYGVDARAGGADVLLPLSLTVAARVLDDAGWRGERCYAAVPADNGADQNAAIGRRLAGCAQRVAILAMGDGSAKRTTEAPGYLDERAEPFDAEVVTELAAADAPGLLAVSPELAADLWVAGLPAWQALAGALDRDARVNTLVRYDAAPRGVGYFVVDWTVQPTT
jgi:hypothetical protein